MPTADDITWFKGEFAAQIVPALAGTPFDIDDIVAIACQETGYLWSTLRRRGLPTARVLELCVGDTVDKRSAFPTSRAALEGVTGGTAMFAIARQALVDMSDATQNADYLKAAAKPDKFCHGFGIFQLDIQFFKTDPDYFLERRYARFDAALAKCVTELKRGARKLGFEGRAALTDMEMAAVAIAYNTGRYNPAKGLRQGWFDGKRYYGENFYNYLRLAHSVPTPGGAPATLPPAAPGEAVLPLPTPVTEEGTPFVVDTVTSDLNVRSTPERDPANPNANFKASLPDGHPVRVTATSPTNGFLPIEASLNGALIRGWASAKFLKPAAADPAAVPPQPAAASSYPAVFLPRRPGTVTRRREPANAASLNEPGQPVRDGATPGALRDDIDAIIGWLAVDNPAHQRYQPGAGRTYCNIYAHDFCTLAGPYLPRVWWNARAIASLARGETVAPRYGATIDEQRANDLFRWLRDFGEGFGWRRTGTLDGLQQTANAGGVGLIVARRRDDGRSGHIVVVVPERGDNAASRDRTGAVVAPLQSQAGSGNFRYGTGKRDWWRGEQFAEFAYWIHG